MKAVFKPGWLATGMFMVSFPLFITLGLWQLNRAEERQKINAERIRHRQEEALQLDGKHVEMSALSYRKIKVLGRFDSAHQFLLDNQVQDQATGYHVLTPFRIQDGTTIMVNRGWIAQGKDRNHLPEISVEESEQEIIGIAENFPRVGYQLAGAEIPGPGWPSLVQVVEPIRLSERLGYPVLTFQLLLDPAYGQGYTRKWHEHPLDAGKNRGYALQWFLFGGMATFFYIRHGLKATG